jgi:hypothetical protein
MSLAKFLQLVHARPSTDNVFNPWRDTDPLNDLSVQSPAHRLSHLTRYMTERLDTAKLLVIAEAVGFQSGKYSGCAMTSERNLLASGTIGSQFFNGEKYRTSKPVLSNGKNNPEGLIEPTSSVVWKTMMGLCSSHDFVLWNSFAWHPHKLGEPLTNRTPTDDELNSGLETLNAFLSVFPDRKIVAVGRKCEIALAALGVPSIAVRHPANGGATKFKDGMTAILKNREW